ncbi:speriolin [Puma concolor]|uniref:Speriolin n=1 Tax=Puma concolor TaxID=9696 RepID=A0A6P6HSJ6_PUMCO|nr:speriolin [Puma concolor]
MANDGMGGARGRHAAGRALQAEGAVSAQMEACVCPERSRSRKEPQGQKQNVGGRKLASGDQPGGSCVWPGTIGMDQGEAVQGCACTTQGPRAESRQLAWERLVGEIAFQLDRRILSSIFPERVRLYGFTVSNIPEKIIQASLNPSDHKLDEELCQTLTQRYVSIMNRLQSLGYDGRVHPVLTEQLVNAYGILRERPELAASEGGSYTVDFLQRVLVETVHPSMLTDALLLLSCLNQLAHDDGKPMFIW